MANKTMATPQKEEAQEFSFRPASSPMSSIRRK
jgi:hypothetical protein